MTMAKRAHLEIQQSVFKQILLDKLVTGEMWVIGACQATKAFKVLINHNSLICKWICLFTFHFDRAQRIRWSTWRKR